MVLIPGEAIPRKKQQRRSTPKTKNDGDSWPVKPSEKHHGSSLELCGQERGKWEKSRQNRQKGAESTQERHQ